VMIDYHFISRLLERRPNSVALLSGLIVSIFSVVAFGVDAGSHHFYNTVYAHVFANPGRFVGTPLEILLSSDFNRIILLSLATTLENPAYILGLTILANCSLLFIGFRILCTHFSHEDSLIITILIGLVANSPIYGIVANEAIFSRKPVATIFLLLSMLSYVRRRAIWGGIYASTAILFHPLNAISALYFFLPSFALFSIQQMPASFIRRLLFSFLPILLVVTYSVQSGPEVSYDPEITSFYDWYTLSLIVEVDDVAMFWKLYKGGFIFLPLFILSFIFSLKVFVSKFKNGSPTPFLHWLNISQFPLLTSAILFEFLQINGLEIVYISEWFSTLQLRRGIWMPILVAVSTLYLFLKTHKILSSKSWILAVGLAIILDHTLVAAVSLTTVVAMATKEISYQIAGAFILLACSVLLIFGEPSVTVKHVVFHAVLFMAVVGLYLAVSSRSRPATALIVTLFFHSSVIVGISVFRNDTFVNSYKYLANSHLSESAAIKSEHAVLSAINQLPINKDSVILFAPMALGYSASFLSNYRLFFSRWDNMLIFDHAVYSRFLQKLVALGLSPRVCGEKFGSGIHCFLEKAQSRIDSLTADELNALKGTLGIRVIVRREPLINKTPIIETKDFFVYE
jgi:hypothetical protein